MHFACRSPGSRAVLPVRIPPAGLGARSAGSADTTRVPGTATDKGKGKVLDMNRSCSRGSAAVQRQVGILLDKFGKAPEALV